MSSPDRFVTVTQAAELTGAQARTIRRWVAPGLLAARSGPFGRLVDREAVQGLVAERLTAPAASADSGAVTDRTEPDRSRGPVQSPVLSGPPVSDPALVALCDRLSRENVERAGRMGFLQARLQDAEARIRLLEAPVESTPAAGDLTNHPTEEAVAPHSVAQRTRRRLWRFWTWRPA